MIHNRSIYSIGDTLSIEDQSMLFPVCNGADGYSAGDYFSRGSFGHLGFTGTSMWIDPNKEIIIVLLTNRVYPSRNKNNIKSVKYVYDIILKEVGIFLIKFAKR